MGIVRERLTSLNYSEVDANGLIKKNQIICAINVLKDFDEDYPKHYYIVIKGETRAGKTGVLYALINIINKLKLKDILGISKILFIT